MSESRDMLKEELQDPEYRHPYAEDFLNTSVAMQIRVLREQRGWTQEGLAEKIGTKQAGISRLENVNYSAWKTETLRKIARAFDVRLKITFETFGTLLDEVDEFSRQNLERPRFDDDSAFHQGGISPARVQTKVQTTVAIATNPLLTSSFQRGMITYMNTNKDVNQFIILGGSIAIPLIGNDATVMSEDNLVLVSGQNVLNADVIAVSCGNTLSSAAQTSGTNSEERTGYVGRGVGTAA